MANEDSADVPALSAPFVGRRSPTRPVDSGVTMLLACILGAVVRGGAFVGFPASAGGGIAWRLRVVGGSVRDDCLLAISHGMLFAVMIYCWNSRQRIVGSLFLILGAWSTVVFNILRVVVANPDFATSRFRYPPPHFMSSAWWKVTTGVVSNWFLDSSGLIAIAGLGVAFVLAIVMSSAPRARWLAGIGFAAPQAIFWTPAWGRTCPPWPYQGVWVAAIGGSWPLLSMAICRLRRVLGGPLGDQPGS